MKRIPSVVFALVLVVLVGCDDKKSETSSSSGAATSETAPKVEPKAATNSGGCLQTAVGMCVQYGTLSTSEIASEKKDCEGEKGKWLASCPSENLLGTCTNAKKGGGLQMKLYKGASFSTAAEAKKALCSDSGDQFVPAK